MIISEKVLVKIGSVNYQHYKNLGYDVMRDKEIIVKVNELLPNSKTFIHVSCDVCGKEKNIMYRYYNNNFNNCGFFSCSPKCSNKKHIITCNKKYGVDNVMHLKEIKEKLKQTFLEKYGASCPFESEKIKEKIRNTNLEKYGCEYGLGNKDVIQKRKDSNLEKYGCENVFQSKEIKEKSKETCLEKYGFEYANQSKDIKIKIKETCLEKYGTECTLQNEEIKNKGKETCLERYGTEYANQNDNVKEKIKQTNLERYGYENPYKSEIIREKGKKTCLERYGCENPFQNKKIIEIIKEKTKITKIERGLQTPDDRLTELEIYKKKVKSITRKNKKKLLEKWNGLDYYDEEYIKDNFDFDSRNDIRFPTIDHKVSIDYGFRNNINPEIIGDIDNLCITKRTNNSSKHNKTEEEFKIIKRFLAHRS